MPPSAASQLTDALLDGAKLDAIDVEVIRDLGDPEEPDHAARDLDARLLAERGDAPGLGVLFEQVTEDVDAAWGPIATDVATLSSAESSPELAALAILLSAGSSTWPGLAARAAELGADDRLARLALAAAALRVGGDEALAFVRDEARRFFAALSTSTTDTAAFAAVALLRKHDSATIAALTDAFRAGAPHGASGRALIGLMGPDPAFAGPLEALVVTGFGRAAEGEPILYAALFANAAPERARGVCSWESEAELERRAAMLAGAVIAQRDDVRLHDAARALLGELDPKDERQSAAGLALLRVVHEAKLDGFADVASQWRTSERSKQGGESLAGWFERNGAEIR